MDNPVLNFSYRSLTHLPELPAAIEILWCDDNQLTYLLELPATLKEFSCSSNKLNLLPKLPLALEKLWCFNNQLTFLPELPAALESLWCHNNLLICLPELPPTLEVLSCGYNKLTCLPELPSTLKELWCYANKLTYLPELPTALKILRCGDFVGNFSNFVGANKDACVVTPSLFEICCNKINEGDKTYIDEIDQKLGERKCCREYGSFTLQHSKLKREIALCRNVVIKYFRCWVCINKI